MTNYEAIGVIETQYMTVAMEILDHVCKGTNVELLANEKYLGGRLVSLIVGGGISDVSAAVELAKEVCQYKEMAPLKMALMITNPHQEILNYIVAKHADEPEEIASGIPHERIRGEEPEGQTEEELENE